MIPVLPDEIADLLDDATPASEPASTAEVKTFLDEHTEATRAEILAGWPKALGNHYAAGASRHDSTVSVLTGAMKEARAGYFSAWDAHDAIRPLFLAEVAKPPASGKQGAARTREAASLEFHGILAWAVGQANAADLDEVRARVVAQMPGNVHVVDASTFAGNNQATTTGAATTSATTTGAATTSATTTGAATTSATTTGATTGATTGVKAFRLPDGLQATDIGNAARLIRDAGHELRYVHAWGKWLVYRDGRWILDEKDALVTEIAKGVSAALFRLAANTAVTQSKKEAKPVWAWALRSCTAGGIAAMVKLARGMPAVIVDHEQLDADPWLLNVANGTIDLRTGTLRSHNPDDLCTMQAPVAYDPKVVAPLWDKCLEKWQPDNEVLDYLQVRTGAGATGIPTETVDIDYGEGGNGKSKFHGAIQHVLGPYATVPHKSLLVAGRYEQHPTVIAKLFRKRLAVASETSAAEALNEEQVKNLTGGDRLEGRRMREDPWEFWPSHTLVMFSNHKPAIRGRDEGVWRRLRLVPWEVTIATKDRDERLLAKLQAEAAGILRWIVDGAVRFDREGLGPPAAVLTATSEYRKSEDVIGRFCDEVLDFDPNVFCYSIDIKSELDEWCEEQDITPPRMNDVAAILRKRGAKDGGRVMKNRKRSTIWHGVDVK